LIYFFSHLQIFSFYFIKDPPCLKGTRVPSHLGECLRKYLRVARVPLLPYALGSSASLSLRGEPSSPPAPKVGIMGYFVNPKTHGQGWDDGLMRSISPKTQGSVLRKNNKIYLLFF
jgi:hypothetical protein